jgi:hypothetical protein
MEYEKIILFEFECSCTNISKKKWDMLMFDAKKANGPKIRKLIKKHIPELYYDLGLEFYNPYEEHSKKTKTHLIYLHSGIEYFFRYQMG